MLKVYIGPNGYGKTTKLINLKKEIDKNEPNNSFMLNSELVLENELKDTINDSMMMDYVINDILSDEKTQQAKINLEKAVDDSINENVNSINEILTYSLSFNEKNITKDVLELRTDKEYKKLVKINSNDLKKSMGSGQRIIFLLLLIKLSKRRYIFLDEPENHCHPSMIHELAKIINELAIEKNVYISTHSPILLSLLRIEFEDVLILNDPLYQNVKRIELDYAVNNTKNIMIENLNNKSKSYFDIDSLKKNIKEIHNKNFFEVLFSKRVYIIEGINDELFLKKILYNFGKQYDDYSIFCSYGKPHMIPFINIFNKLGIEVIVIYDSDEIKYPNDENNKSINKWIKDNSKSYSFIDNLEEELGVKNKYETPGFIELLDHTPLDQYKDIVS